MLDGHGIEMMPFDAAYVEAAATPQAKSCWHPDAFMRLLGSEQKIIAGVGRKKGDKPNNDPEARLESRRLAQSLDRRGSKLGRRRGFFAAITLSRLTPSSSAAFF